MAKKTDSNPETTATTSTEEALVKPEMESLDIVDVLRSAGLGNSEDWEIDVADSSAYWLSEPGALLVGTVLNSYEIVTSKVVNGKPLKAIMYSIRLLRNPMTTDGTTKAITSDGEEIAANPGDVVAVLQRSLLTCLQKNIGLDVLIYCKGKDKTKGGQDLWRYSVAHRKPAAKQAANQLNS